MVRALSICGRSSLFCVFILLFLLYSEAFGASETFTKTGRDRISLSEISPRTNSFILTPSSFSYSVNAHYTLQTMEKAYIVVNVYRFTAGGKKEVCLTSPRKAVFREQGSHGAGSFSFVSDRITLREHPATGDKLLFVASLLNEKGEEAAFSSSVNFLSGELTLKERKRKDSKNYLKVLSVNPEPGTMLKTGVGTSFRFKFSYSVCNSTGAFALLQFSSMKGGKGAVLREYYVPVPEGRGNLSVKIGKVSIPEATRGEVLGVLIPFRISPGSGDFSLDTVWPYQIAR